MKNQKIGIIGCGWLGKKLASHLKKDHEICTTSSKSETAEDLKRLGFDATVASFSSDEVNIKDQWSISSSLDAIFVLIPLSQRRSSKEELSIKIENISKFIGDFDGLLTFASSTGVYPQETKEFEEDDLPTSENFIENQIRRHFPKANLLRFGGLMGSSRLLSNYPVKNLKDPVNHIHHDDACSAMIKVIELRKEEILYNVVAPLHPSKEQVIEAQETGILSPYRAPEGRTISSSKLTRELGFAFSYPDPRTFHL